MEKMTEYAEAVWMIAGNPKPPACPSGTTLSMFHRELRARIGRCWTAERLRRRLRSGEAQFGRDIFEAVCSWPRSVDGETLAAADVHDEKREYDGTLRGGVQAGPEIAEFLDRLLEAQDRLDVAIATRKVTLYLRWNRNEQPQQQTPATWRRIDRESVWVSLWGDDTCVRFREGETVEVWFSRNEIEILVGHRHDGWAREPATQGRAKKRRPLRKKLLKVVWAAMFGDSPADGVGFEITAAPLGRNATPENVRSWIRHNVPGWKLDGTGLRDPGGDPHSYDSINTAVQRSRERREQKSECP
jgi:hypothetical protein